MYSDGQPSQVSASYARRSLAPEALFRDTFRNKSQSGLAFVASETQKTGFKDWRRDTFAAFSV